MGSGTALLWWFLLMVLLLLLLLLRKTGTTNEIPVVRLDRER